MHPPSLRTAQTLLRPHSIALGGSNALILEGHAEVEATVRAVLRDVLGLDAVRVDAFTDTTELFGALPEMDSMAVASVLTELEDRLGITIDDDDVDGAMLETFGALTAFAARKALV